MISSVTVKNFGGYFICHSRFGSHHLTCDRFSYRFEPGITILYGDIDCGGWGVSSAFSQKCKDTVLSPDEFSIEINDSPADLGQIYANACYMDLIRSRKSVDKLVAKALKKNHSQFSAEDIREIFEITPERFRFHTSGVGNEHFRCAAAIAYASSKSVYCFPWISKKMVEYYGLNLQDVLDILAKLGKIVILPTNYYFEKYKDTTYDFQKEEEKFIQSEIERMRKLGEYGPDEE